MKILKAQRDGRQDFVKRNSLLCSTSSTIAISWLAPADSKHLHIFQCKSGESKPAAWYFHMRFAESAILA